MLQIGIGIFTAQRETERLGKFLICIDIQR